MQARVWFGWPARPEGRAPPRAPRLSERRSPAGTQRSVTCYLEPFTERILPFTALASHVFSNLECFAWRREVILVICDHCEPWTVGRRWHRYLFCYDSLFCRLACFRDLLRILPCRYALSVNPLVVVSLLSMSLSYEFWKPVMFTSCNHKRITFPQFAFSFS